MSDPTVLADNDFKYDGRMFDVPHLKIGPANQLDSSSTASAYNPCSIAYH
jgi:hypothetical protein